MSTAISKGVVLNPDAKEFSVGAWQPAAAVVVVEEPKAVEVKAAAPQPKAAEVVVQPKAAEVVEQTKAAEVKVAAPPKKAWGIVDQPKAVAPQPKAAPPAKATAPPAKAVEVVAKPKAAEAAPPPSKAAEAVEQPKATEVKAAAPPAKKAWASKPVEVVDHPKAEAKGGAPHAKGAEVVEPFAPPDLGSIHWGNVVSVHPFGAFVRLDDVPKDGLCHVSQLKHPVAGGKRVEARDVVSEGQRIVCKVVDRSFSKMRFFLSAKCVDQETGKDLDPEMVQHKAEAEETRAAPREPREPREAGERSAKRQEDAGAAKGGGASAAPQSAKHEDAGKDGARREGGKPQGGGGGKPQFPQGGKKEGGQGYQGGQGGPPGGGGGGGGANQHLTISVKVCKALAKSLKTDGGARTSGLLVSKISVLLRTLREPDTAAAPARAERKPEADASEGAGEGGAAGRGEGDDDGWEQAGQKGKSVKVDAKAAAAKQSNVKQAAAPVTVQREAYTTALANLIDAGVCKQLVRAIRKEALGNTVLVLAEAIRDCAGDECMRGALGEAGACEELASQLGPDGLRAEDERPRLAVVQAIRSLALNHTPNRERMRATGVIEPLVAVLSQRSLAGGRGLAAAAQALRDLCCDNDANRAAFLDAGAASVLVAAITAEHFPDAAAPATSDKAADAPAASAAEAALLLLLPPAAPAAPAAPATSAWGPPDAKVPAVTAGPVGEDKKGTLRDWARCAILQAIRTLAYGTNGRGRALLASAGACEALAHLLKHHPLPLPRGAEPKAGTRGGSQAAAACEASVAAAALAVANLSFSSDENRAKLATAGAPDRLKALQREQLHKATRQAIQSAIQMLAIGGAAPA